MCLADRERVKHKPRGPTQASFRGQQENSDSNGGRGSHARSLHATWVAQVIVFSDCIRIENEESCRRPPSEDCTSSWLRMIDYNSREKELRLCQRHREQMEADE